MNNKEIFIEQMKARTKKFAVDIISFCETLKASSNIKELDSLLQESIEINKITSKAKNSTYSKP